MSTSLVEFAEIVFGNGKILKIKVENQSAENVHVKEVILIGKKLGAPFLKHSDLIGAGEMLIEMK